MPFFLRIALPLSSLPLSCKSHELDLHLMLNLQAWRAALPLGKGSYYLGTQPLIHKGFLQAWQGIAAPVVDAVRDIVGRAIVAKKEFEILVTGTPQSLFHAAALWFPLLYSLQA